MQDEIDLDDLYREAKAAVRLEAETRVAKAKATVRRPGEPKAREGAKLWSDPDNWNRGKNVALLHRETQTLLGVFSEWTHVSEPDCRRLVREEAELPVHCIEEVSGDWGWKGPVALDHEDSTVRELTTELYVTLTRPAVTAYCLLTVVTQLAGIHSVKLHASLSFGGEGEILFLPAGTNILPVMSQESKIALREVLAHEY